MNRSPFRTEIATQTRTLHAALRAWHSLYVRSLPHGRGVSVLVEAAGTETAASATAGLPRSAANRPPPAATLTGRCTGWSPRGTGAAAQAGDRGLGASARRVTSGSDATSGRPLSAFSTDCFMAACASSMPSTVSAPGAADVPEPGRKALVEVGGAVRSRPAVRWQHHVHRAFGQHASLHGLLVVADQRPDPTEVGCRGGQQASQWLCQPISRSWR